MPVSARAGLLLALLLAGCSGSSATTDGGPADAGPSDSGDAGRTCYSIDAGCSAQADCFGPAGEGLDSVHIYTCGSDGRCQRQARFQPSCFADVALAQVQITLASGWGTIKPKAFEIRAFYPTRVDGSALTCADVQSPSDFPDGGSPLDVDPTLNVQIMLAAAASCTSGAGCIYVSNVNLVPGTAPVILVRAYSGGPDTSGIHATGVQLGTGGCVTAAVTEQSNPPQTIDVTVNP